VLQEKFSKSVNWKVILKKHQLIPFLDTEQFLIAYNWPQSLCW